MVLPSSIQGTNCSIYPEPKQKLYEALLDSAQLKEALIERLIKHKRVILPLELLNKELEHDDRGQAVLELLRTDSKTFFTLFREIIAGHFDDFMGESLHEAIQEGYKIPIRLKGSSKNFPPIYPYQLRHHHLGKFVCIQGLIAGLSKVELLEENLLFNCSKCGDTRLLPLEDFKAPKKMACFQCRHLQNIRTEDIKPCNVVRIILDEPATSSLDVPTRLLLLLRHDACDEKTLELLTSGSEVIVTGTYNMYRAETGIQGYVDVNFMDFIEKRTREFIPTPEDIKEFETIKDRPDIVEFIGNELFRDVMGHEDVKSSLVAAVIGGVTQIRADGNRRGNIHILLAGDTSTAKSRLALSIASMRLTEKISSCQGGQTSGVGLTSTVVKDELLGRWISIKGALPRAHGGICIADELDKIKPEDLKNIHSAIEHQKITVNKADQQGVEFKCETSLISTSNPIGGGVFDRKKDFVSQLGFAGAIMSRMDLTWLFFAHEKEALDKIARRKFMGNTECPMLSEEELSFYRKYIAYARTFKPTANDEVNRFAHQQFSARVTSLEDKTEQARRIDPRAIDAVIRLMTARAKARLSNTITVEDAIWAIELKRKNFLQLGWDEQTGTFDLTNFSTGQTSKTHAALKTIREIMMQYPGGAWTENELFALCQEYLDTMTRVQFEDQLDKLSRAGMVIQQRIDGVAKYKLMAEGC